MPDAFLAWIVEEKAADLLRGHRALDELIVLRRRWWRSPSTVLALRHYLRKLRFDITIDAQGLSKSSIPAWMSGARRRIGFDGDEGREVSRWFNNELVLPKRSNVVERESRPARVAGYPRRHAAVRFHRRALRRPHGG